MIKKIVIISLLILTTSCLSRVEKSGYSFELTDYKVQEGASTKSEILQNMGSPTLVDDIDGTESWIYLQEDVRSLLFFKSYHFGIFAEYLVIIFLFCKGYKILKRRHKSYFGEIDIIAKKGDILAIIEVKARKIVNNIEEVLSFSQQKRISEAGSDFFAKNKKYQNLGMRFDLIIVKPFKIPLHLKGYFD